MSYWPTYISCIWEVWKPYPRQGYHGYWVHKWYDLEKQRSRSSSNFSMNLCPSNFNTFLMVTWSISWYIWMCCPCITTIRIYSITFKCFVIVYDHLDYWISNLQCKTLHEWTDHNMMILEKLSALCNLIDQTLSGEVKWIDSLRKHHGLLLI